MPSTPWRLPTRLALAVVLGLAALLVALTAISAGPSADARDAAIRPAPEDAQRARGRLPKDGCFLSRGEERSPACVYGDRDSRRRVFLLGDSHAMHTFPALGPIARERGWRIVVLTKAGCPPNLAVKAGTECSRWRNRALRRIEASRSPDMVITGGSVNYRVFDGGAPVGPRARRRALTRGYLGVVRRVARTGARTVVLKDVPRAPFDVPDCVAANLDDPRACEFDLDPGHWDEFDAEVARRTGSRLVRMTGEICQGPGRCRSVIERRLVYRAGSHLTAPFARTLRAALARELPRIRQPRR